MKRKTHHAVCPQDGTGVGLLILLAIFALGPFMGAQASSAGFRFSLPFLIAQAEVEDKSPSGVESQESSPPHGAGGNGGGQTSDDDAPVICACTPLESLEQYDAVVLREPVLGLLIAGGTPRVRPNLTYQRRPA
jgi:hypothetical protein